MKQRDAGHTLKEEVKKKAMELKPELIAVSPETGKRHRWEIVETRPPTLDEFFLDFGENDAGTWCAKVCGAHTSRWLARPILRDLGPVEEEKKETLVELIERKRSESIVLQAIGKEEMVEAFRHKFGLEPEDCELVERRDIGGITWCVRRRPAGPEDVAVLYLKTRVGELEACLRKDAEALRSSNAAIVRAQKDLDRSELDRQQAEARVGELETELAISKENATRLWGERSKNLDRIRELEAHIAAPLPVGVVRLPILGKSECGNFGFDSIGPWNEGDWWLMWQYDHRVACNLRPWGSCKDVLLLRRLDAPEEKKTEKPPNSGPITAKAWELRKANDEKPAPCPYCEGKGTDPLDGRWDCRKCDGTGVEMPAPPKEEPKLKPVDLGVPPESLRNSWSLGRPARSMTLDHC